MSKTPASILLIVVAITGFWIGVLINAKVGVVIAIFALLLTFLDAAPR